MFSQIRKEIKSSVAYLYSSGVDLSHFNIIYDLSWKILSAYQSHDCKVWSRNSFYFRKFIPGLSDIDISVTSKNKPEEFLLWKDTLKIFFPWIGEVNWYPSLIASEMCFLCNKVELSRDPILSGNLQCLSTEVTDIDRFIFIVRMIDYDKSGLQSHPRSRTRKWAYHWDLVKSHGNFSGKNQFIENLSLEVAIDLACEFVHEDKKDKIKEVLIAIFNHGERCDWLMPHKYLNLYDFNVQECESYFPEATQAQIDWEFWGVCTQAYWLPKESFYEHLYKLNNINFPILIEHRSQARKKILNYVEQNF